MATGMNIGNETGPCGSVRVEARAFVVYVGHISGKYGENRTEETGDVLSIEHEGRTSTLKALARVKILLDWSPSLMVLDRVEARD